MADILSILTWIGILLLIGIIVSIISTKIKVPDILLLILIGIVVGNLTFKGIPVIEFPELFLTGMGIFALVMIVFDSCAKLRIREVDFFSTHAIKLAGIFLLLVVIILPIATKFIYGTGWLLAILFATVMAGTSPSVVLSLLGDTKNKVVEVIQLESIINTPLTVLLPFMVLEFREEIETSLIVTKFIEQITPFLLQIIVGIGAGMLMGIIVFKIMKKYYSEKLSPLAIITAALLTYILAENLQGNGVLAVTTLGLFFGNLKVKQKTGILGFESVFSNSLRILVFILLGLIIKVPLTFEFFAKSIGLFIIYVGIRALAVLSLKKDYNWKERLFMSLNVSKGIAVSVVAFFLLTVTVPGMQETLHLILSFIVYSIILASITAWFSKFLIHKKIDQEE